MGTRGIMGVRIDGQDKLTYNHFDSYPDGLGEAMVKDIRQHLANFPAQARALVLVDTDIPPTPEQIAKLRPYTDLGVSEQSETDWYCLLRKTQGELAQTLEAGIMIDSHDFVKDSLFCEWAYIVNLDDGVFEVYRGFQTELSSQAGRYAVTVKPPFKPSYVGAEQYLPISLVATFPLKDIPEDWIKQLPGDDDDDDDDGGGDDGGGGPANPEPDPIPDIQPETHGEVLQRIEEEREPISEPKPEPVTTSHTFVVDAKEFRAALELAVAEKKTTIPVLSEVCLVPQGSTVQVLSTDLDKWTVSDVPAMIDDGAGKFLMPHRKALELLKGETGIARITAKVTTLKDVFSYAWVNLQVGGCEYDLPSMNPQNFPEVPEIPKVGFTIPGADLKAALGRITVAISTGESRYSMNGALFECSLKPRKLILVATDGHRLALDSIALSKSRKGKAVIHRGALAWLHKHSAGDVTLSFGETHSFFHFADAATTLITRNLKDQFPDYHKVLPAADSFNLSANFASADELGKMLVKVARMADDRSGAVKFRINGACTLSASSYDSGSASATVKASVKHSDGVDEIVTGFNSAYVLDALKVAGNMPITLSLTDNQSAGVFTIPSIPEYSYVLMPMRV